MIRRTRPALHECDKYSPGIDRNRHRRYKKTQIDEEFQTGGWWQQIVRPQPVLTELILQLVALELSLGKSPYRSRPQLLAPNGDT